MSKIEQIKDAIARADRLDSKLTRSNAYHVPALSSLRIRCLMNNLGGLATNYMEVGTHVGGLFCSALSGNKNIKHAVAIDSWASDHMNGNVHEEEFLNNIKVLDDATNMQIIKADCFDVDLSKITVPIDFYLFDAGHSKEEQKMALSYYYPVLADEFIYCCDDWQYGDVKQGTIEGISECNLDILFDKELLNPDGYTEDQHLNEHWWRGYYVALLKKK